ncbi:MAG: hypothetical protein U0800_04555 [Isosphaeraceae bacterium]
MVRKQKLRERARKRAREQDRRDAVRDRLLAALGLDEAFQMLPGWLRGIFLLKMRPGIEVASAAGYEDDPEIEAVVRRIRRQVLQPSGLELEGRPFAASLDDCERGLWCILEGFRFLRGLSKTSTLKQVTCLAPMLEAIDRKFSEGLHREIIYKLMHMETDLAEIANEGYRVDRRMLSIDWAVARKPEGRHYRRLEVRAHATKPTRLGLGGESRLAYPCQRGEYCNGLMMVRWDLQRLGLANEPRKLPVYVSPHAVARFDERLPIECGSYSLHNLIPASLREPRLLPGRDGTWLVAVEPNAGRLGYLVAQILPDYVLIKTFLFLTMQGTPESGRLKARLGVYRADAERFELDRCKTWIDSDITHDPLIKRALSDCGCGHLLTWCSDDRRLPWLRRHGEQLKEALALREAEGGYMVGRKWVRWTEADLQAC